MDVSEGARGCGEPWRQGLAVKRDMNRQAVFIKLRRRLDFSQWENTQGEKVWLSERRGDMNQKTIQA